MSNKWLAVAVLTVVTLFGGSMLFPHLLCQGDPNYGYHAFSLGGKDGKGAAGAFIIYGGPGKTQSIALDTNRDGIIDARFRISMSTGKTTCYIDSDCDGTYDEVKNVEATGGVAKLTTEKLKNGRKADRIDWLEGLAD